MWLAGLSQSMILRLHHPFAPQQGRSGSVCERVRFSAVKQSVPCSGRKGVNHCVDKTSGIKRNVGIKEIKKSEKDWRQNEDCLKDSTGSTEDSVWKFIASSIPQD